jgi:uncharacterized membrane protein YoaK (UPF0700 family)
MAMNATIGNAMYCASGQMHPRTAHSHRGPAVAKSARTTSYQARPLALAICLAALAGFVDALGFLFMRGLYVSFMSGNSTQMATEIGRADWHAAASAAGLIGSFVFGVIVAQLFARHVALDLAAVGVLLAVAGVLHRLGHTSAVTLVMAMAMGMENCVLDRDGDVTLSLTYVTGTLVKFGRRLALALLGRDPLGWLPYLLLWCGFFGGAVAGAVAFGTFGLEGMWFAAALAFLLIPAAVWLRPAASEE